MDLDRAFGGVQYVSDYAAAADSLSSASYVATSSDGSLRFALTTGVEYLIKSFQVIMGTASKNAAVTLGTIDDSGSDWSPLPCDLYQAGVGMMRAVYEPPVKVIYSSSKAFIAPRIGLTDSTAVVGILFRGISKPI